MAHRSRPETPATCDCPRGQHRHGTVVMYKHHRCGCQSCRLAKTTYDNDYNHRTGRATKPVPADTARAHIRDLMGSGMTLTSIAEASGLHPDTLSRIRRGQPRIYQDVEGFILAVALPDSRPASRAHWSTGTATSRRLRGLAVMGWSAAAIAQHAGVSDSWVKDLRAGTSPDVAKATEEFIARLTADLLRRPAPDGRSAAITRGHAARNGWVSMFAYDDLNDPDETPNVTPIGMGRIEGFDARTEELRHLINGGARPEEAAARAGYPNLKAAISAVRHRELTVLEGLLTGEAA